MKFVSYKIMKKFVLSKKIKTKEGWDVYKTKHKLPEGIPRRPSHIYKNNGWKSWSRFLENGNDKIKRRSFNKARIFARKLKLKNSVEWDKLHDSGKIPKDIPKTCSQAYVKNWKGWGNFLGSNIISVSDYKKYYPTFEELKKLVNQKKIVTQLAYTNLCKKYTTNKKIRLPFKVEKTYPKEFKSWNDFLNIKRHIYATANDFLSYKEAKKVINDLKIKSIKEYLRLYDKGKIPQSIPKYPELFYAKALK